MGAMYREDDPWAQQAARAESRELDRMQPGLLKSLSLGNSRWAVGECAGCGAIWHSHPLQNALAKDAGECSYCRRPRRSMNGEA